MRLAILAWTLPWAVMAVETGTLPQDHPLVEWSGLASCRSGAGSWWAINDGGNPSEVILLDADLSTIRRLPIAVANADWEDLAASDGRLFIADIGDNQRRRASIQVIAVTEPGADGLGPLAPLARWTLRYPDGPCDAEALVIHGDQGWIIDKRPAAARIWRFALDERAEQVLEAVGSCPLPGPILAADLSRDGRWLSLAFPLGVHRVPLAVAGDPSTLISAQAQTTVLPIALQREAIAESADGKHLLSGDERRQWWSMPIAEPAASAGDQP